jgi:hypothetical protein
MSILIKKGEIIEFYADEYSDAWEDDYKALRDFNYSEVLQKYLDDNDMTLKSREFEYYTFLKYLMFLNYIEHRGPDKSIYLGAYGRVGDI